MADQQGADQAVEALNGHMSGDRYLEVLTAEEKETPAANPFARATPKYLPVSKLFIYFLVVGPSASVTTDVRI
jgi:hypothetical protein